MARKLATALAMRVSALATPAFAEKASAFFSDYFDFNEKGQAFLDKIEPKTGLVELPNGVNLNLGDKFYFVDSEDARAILTEAWGNPSETASHAAGMVFPHKTSPLSETWGIELRPDAIGYVNDSDAASINYDELLASMKEETAAENPDRIKAGYDSIELIGWAMPPKYDFVGKRLYWAKELQFGNSDKHTLNYDVRFLNREGVFVMSYIATMDQLPEVNDSLPDVLKMVSFDNGKRYSDYLPGADKVAAVGVGGLIAGKVLAKTGFLVVALIALKKFGVVLLFPLIWLWRKIRGRVA
jgi:uncharacterized membrane-anchored protein